MPPPDVQNMLKSMTDFHLTYNNDALWDKDERVTFRGQKVTGQCHMEQQEIGYFRL